MAHLHISGVEEIKQYAPNLDYGISYIPAPPDGERHSSWIGGWCLAIPKGSRHPEAAWRFIKWACRDPGGTAAAGRIQGLFPGYRKSPYFDTIRGKPGYGMFLRILEECRHQRPVMPAQEALRQAARETQIELDLRLAGR